MGEGTRCGSFNLPRWEATAISMLVGGCCRDLLDLLQMMGHVNGIILNQIPERHRFIGAYPANRLQLLRGYSSDHLGQMKVVESPQLHQIRP